MNSQMELSVIDDARINEERVLKMVSDAQGSVYGQTKSGMVFRIDNQKVSEVYESSELGMETISSILADPFQAGKVYIAETPLYEIDYKLNIFVYYSRLVSQSLRCGQILY